MSGTDRCDEVLRLIDQVLAEVERRPSELRVDRERHVRQRPPR